MRGLIRTTTVVASSLVGVTLNYYANRESPGSRAKRGIIVGVGAKRFCTSLCSLLTRYYLPRLLLLYVRTNQNVFFFFLLSHPVVTEFTSYYYAILLLLAAAASIYFVNNNTGMVCSAGILVHTWLYRSVFKSKL